MAKEVARRASTVPNKVRRERKQRLSCCGWHSRYARADQLPLPSGSRYIKQYISSRSVLYYRYYNWVVNNSQVTTTNRSISSCESLYYKSYWGLLVMCPCLCSCVVGEVAQDPGRIPPPTRCTKGTSVGPAVRPLKPAYFSTTDR